MRIDLIDVSEGAPRRRPNAALAILLVCIAMLPVGATVALAADTTAAPLHDHDATDGTLSVDRAAPAMLGPPTSDESEAPPGLELRLTSIDGRFEAYADPLAHGASIYEPGGRDHTTIEIRDQLTGATTTHTFARNLEPEAFSPNGQQLYVIDHRPAEDPQSYRVSGIRLATGELRAVFGPTKTELPEEMRGSGRQQVWSTDGTQLYTLYVRQYHEHDHDGEFAIHPDASPEAAFVHVLDVESGWAICLDLPTGFGLGPADSTAIMLTGVDVITVVDHALGMRIDIQRLAETGQFVIGEPSELGL